MRYCVFVLLALCCLIPINASPLLTRTRGGSYKLMQGVNTKQTLRETGVTDIALLERACDAEPACYGFDANGVLKSSFHQEELEAVEGEQLFVKQAISAPGNIWPAPSSYFNGGNTLVIASPFSITTSTPFQDLADAIQRYTDLIFQHSLPASSLSYQAGMLKNASQVSDVPTLSSLVISVKNPNAPLQLGVDESYSLNIPDDGTAATLVANTYFGALHGLETFSQLVFFNFSSHDYILTQAPWSINDAPRFPHRGLLIDTSRHFEPLATIKTVINSMTYAKLNTLHWHVVDSQSFPWECRAFPNLWAGSYSVQERYTQEDVTEVVEYARQRGVRVVIEFDVPGHAASWCSGYPEICPSQTCLEPLDPSSQKTFDVISGIINEVAHGGPSGSGLLLDNFVHLGGDEVDPTCWSQTPHIVNWMAERNYTTDDAYMYIVEKAHQIVLQTGRRPINWEEVFNHFGTRLDNSTIIHVWLDFDTLARVVSSGFNGLLSNDVWYLDHLDVVWQKFYLNEPFSKIPNPAQQALVLGGEVCMWGETVDSSDIFNTVWPRAAAAAERLWSPASIVDTDAALVRLERFRCLLHTRGIDAAPVNNALARDAPPAPGGCYTQ